MKEVTLCTPAFKMSRDRRIVPWINSLLDEYYHRLLLSLETFVCRSDGYLLVGSTTVGLT